MYNTDIKYGTTEPKLLSISKCRKRNMPSGNLRAMLYCIVRLCRDSCTMIGCSLSSHILVVHISRMFPMLGSDNKRCGIVAEALIETAGSRTRPTWLISGRIRLHLWKQNENGYTSPRYTQNFGESLRKWTFHKTSIHIPSGYLT